MIYVVTALKAEAQAFVDKYRLQPSLLGGYKLFSNDTMRVIVSNVGVTNAMLATQALIDAYDITDDDVYLNVGICGASKGYAIGEFFEIGEIVYEEKSYIVHPYLYATITCVDKQITTDKYEIVDMESFGFYDAIRHSTAIKNFHIYKVVSDHFEPETITKEFTKSLIFKNLEKIMKDKIWDLYSYYWWWQAFLDWMKQKWKKR